MLEFGDFQCPACRSFFREIEEVRKAHPELISLSFRHSPLSYHRQAYPSARAAECAADQGRFEDMYKVLYSEQDSLGHVPYSELGRKAGVTDLTKFARCVADTVPVPRIERDLLAAKTTQIPGTPAMS